MSESNLEKRTITLRYKPNFSVLTLDQTKLPQEVIVLELVTCDDIVDAIKTMKIRGAPLLGAAAAYALALEAHNSIAKNSEELLKFLENAAQKLKKTRPTAVNLFWAIDRVLSKAKTFNEKEALADFVIEEAQKIADEDAMTNFLIGKNGANLLFDGDIILTHCNAGALATVEYGTALGVVKTAWDQGKKIKVIATETRPKLQGARLTTFELKRYGIPVTLITDSMVGYVMSRRLINKIIVGADRIVKDAIINKVCTFTIAVLAKEHNIPFYVAAPKSTFDLSNKSENIIIEQRSSDEVTQINSHKITIEGIDVLNPSFDITPMKYVTAIICEEGILDKKELEKLC